jgi:hypothetical protein
MTLIFVCETLNGVVFVLVNATFEESGETHVKVPDRLERM